MFAISGSQERGEAQSQMELQTILAGLEVKAGRVLDLHQAVVKGLAVNTELGRSSRDAAGVVEIGPCSLAQLMPSRA